MKGPVRLAKNLPHLIFPRFDTMVSLLFALLVSLSGCTADPLLRSAEQGDSARLHALLQEGIAVDQHVNSMGETALIIAAQRGHLDFVRPLLDAGADIHAIARYNNTALTAATYSCHSNVALYLIERGADVNIKNHWSGYTPLIFAAECGDVEVVKALLANRANLNDANKKGGTALITAAIKGHVRVADILLAAGADVNQSGKYVESPLYEAAQHGHEAMVTLLLSKGADVNYRSLSNDWTPLMIAAAEKQAGTVAPLLQAGANVNLANEKGRTALMFAASYGSLPITEMLLKRGANPNLVPHDSEGKTALMAAAGKGHKDVVELLLTYHTDPNVRNMKNQTALSYAESYGDGATQQVLINAGGIR